MKDWSQPFEIIYKKFCNFMISMGAQKRDITEVALKDFLGVSQGKLTAWKRGQWPSAEDLANISAKLGLSYRWLVTGEGDPEGPDAPATAMATPAPAAPGRLAELEAENARLREQLAEEKAARKEAELRAEDARDELLDLYREVVGRPRRHPRKSTADERLRELREDPASYPVPTTVLQERAKTYGSKRKAKIKDAECENP